MTHSLLQQNPYIIAEAGVNHNGDPALAGRLIEAAQAAGADCVKFQAFTTEELVLPTAAKAEYQKASGPDGENQHQMLKKLELSPASFAALKHQADTLGIDLLVTPFSAAWVARLAALGLRALKIGSGDTTSPDLLAACAQTGLPIIFSTGMSGLDEIDRTLAFLRAHGARELYPLHCVSLYPTPLELANLAAIETIHRHTGLPTGFSDHTTELFTGALAVAAGAIILEKHFTLDRSLPGPDHAMSLTPDDLARYIAQARAAAPARGSGDPAPSVAELAVKQAARRSIVAARPITAGQILTADLLAFKRPGTGIPPGQMNQILGLKAKCAIEADTLLAWNLLTQPE